MKDTKNYLLLLFLGIVLACSENSETVFNGNRGNFVRFFMLVNNNNKVLEYPEINGGLEAVAHFTKDNLRTLKIPVALTTTTIENPIEVDFTSEVKGLSNYTISPADKLVFTNEKRVDTIYIKINENWDLSLDPEIKLSLNSASDSSILIGAPNTDLENNELTINFKEVNFSYLFNISRKEIIGINQEVFNFKVLFPNGFITSDVENIPLFSEPNTFDYTIEQQPIIKEDEVAFTLTVNETLAEDTSLDTFLSLVALPNYIKGANDCLQISKPIKVDRSGAPAKNFYDFEVFNPFYRLFGEYWRYDTADLVCEWRSTSVFPVPVIVSKEDANALFYSDNGTPTNDTDDIYHHKYKLGFVGNFAPIGTNPFAIRNLFEGERVDSPGLTLPEAIEFFPLNGNSTTEGAVNVISQKIILVRSSDLTAFNIPISGTGTYILEDLATNLWKIDLEIIFDTTAINGEIITRNYLLYNNRNYPDPAPLAIPCPRVIIL